jgi:hypothetical protein
MSLRLIVPMALRGRYKGALDLAGGAPGGIPAFDLPFYPDLALENGVSANEADLLYAASLVIAPSGSQTLTLTGGSIKDPFGAGLTFAYVKAILARVYPNSPGGLVVGNAAANTFVGPFGAAANTLAAKPGGEILLVNPQAGWAVGVGASDQLKFANDGAVGPVNFDLYIVGTSR